MAQTSNEPRALTAAFSDRQVDWISQFNSDASKLNDVKLKRARLESFMRNSAKDEEDVKREMLASGTILLPDKDLQWINQNDIRLLRWLVNRINSPNFGFGQPSQPPILSWNPEQASNPYKFFIQTLDFWQAPLQQKQLFIQSAKNNWSKVILKDEKLKWLEKNNPLQVSWAWRYLNDYLDRKGKFEDRYSPTDTNDTYIAIFSVFDNWSQDKEDLYDLQKNLKLAWSQQKYRKNLASKDKKQSTYAISTETKERLRHLARENKVNLHQMLEYIINDAYEDLQIENSKKSR